MQFCSELIAEVDLIQQQMVDVNKRVHTDALTVVRRLRKGIGFTTVMLTLALAEGRKP